MPGSEPCRGDSLAHGAARLVVVRAIPELTGTRHIRDIRKRPFQTRVHVQYLQGSQPRRVDNQPRPRNLEHPSRDRRVAASVIGFTDASDIGRLIPQQRIHQRRFADTALTQQQARRPRHNELAHPAHRV